MRSLPTYFATSQFSYKGPPRFKGQEQRLDLQVEKWARFWRAYGNDNVAAMFGKYSLP
jgi:hypothetical protein